MIKEILENNALIKNSGKKRRKYLGMSEIGHKCERYLWLKFHGHMNEEFSGSILRLFEDGNAREEKLVSEMKQAGIYIEGQQDSLGYGSFWGHCDGIIYLDYEKYVLEIKGANEKSFNTFKKMGVKNHPYAGPKYYAQVQCYMGFSGLEKALFLIENKNNNDIYEEIIEFDRECFKSLTMKADRIIEGNIPPGISTRKDWHECFYCQANNDDLCRKTWHGEYEF